MPGRPLTHRQLEVLEFVAKGLTNADIARVLGIGLGTAKHHVSAVIDALAVSNRAEAAAALNELELGRRVAPVPRESDSSVPGFGERPAIALLPLEDLGGRSEDAWFVRGFLGDLTRKAGGLRWFPVIQRDSALAAGDGDPGELDARYHVQGTMLRDGEQLSLTLRVVDAESGEHVWADRLERPLAELQQAQDEIVERIAGQLEPAVMRVEQIRGQRERAEQIAVWDYCKRAEYQIDLETPESHRESVALFDRALALDRGSPRAWAGLALSHSAALYLGFSDSLAETSRRARDAASQALEIAPDDFEARISLGRALALSREDEAAVPVLESALELDPSSALGSNTLGGALRRLGRLEEAIVCYERSIRLSPLSSQVYHVCGGLSLAHLAADRYQDALDWARRAVEGEPVRSAAKALDFWPVIPAALALLGEVDEARSLWSAGGPRTSRTRMRHSARFTGAKLDRLREGLRLAGWEGELR